MENQLRILARPAFHRNKPVLLLSFPYFKEAIEKVRSLPGVLWSNSLKSWYMPDTARTLKALRDLEGAMVILEGRQPETEKQDSSWQERMVIIRYAKGRIKVLFRYEPKLVALIKTLPFYYYDAEAHWWTLPHIDTVLEVLQNYCKEKVWKLEYRDEWAERKLVLRKRDVSYQKVVCPPQFEDRLKSLRYSESTIRNYCSAIREFIHFFEGRELETILQADIEKFILYITEQRNVSTSYHNICLCAIKFYFEKILERPQITFKLERPRREKVLPEVLSEEEIVRLFNKVTNLKHKCILMAIYSGGLRLSEVVGLKVGDIDSKRMMIFIRGGKGSKDRYTILSKELLGWLRKYYREEKPETWLFEGVTGGQYSMRSVQSIMHDAVKKSGIRKHATVHTLRHSFATHMLENGTDLRYIQNLLGHNSTKTTEIYTHITTKGLEQLVSPFDRLKLGES
jgi:integrase/recombinase XerD